MLALLILAGLVGLLLLVPLMIVGFVLRLVVSLAILPFRIAGTAIRLTLGLVAATIGLALGAAGLVVGAAFLGVALLIPLLPLLGLAAGIWLVWRLVRRGPAPAHGVVRS